MSSLLQLGGVGGLPAEDMWHFSEEVNMGGIRGWLSLAHFEQLRKQGRASVQSWISLYILNPRSSWLDTQFVVVCAAALVLLRFVFCGIPNSRTTKTRSLIPFLGTKAGLIKKGKIHRFSEVVWYFCWHTTSLCWGLGLLYAEAGTPEAPGWVRYLPIHPDGRWFWVATEAERAAGSLGWPLLLPSDLLRYFYLTQISFWISCLCCLSTEARRSDDLAMGIHHAATVCLLSLSYLSSYWRLGLLTLILHDVVDVFLFLCKALHYTVLPGGLSEGAFVGLLSSYFIARLVLFPFYCVRSVVDLRYMKAVLSRKDVDCSMFPGGIFLSGLLVVLLVLHMYWFYLIICMAFRVLRAKKAGGDLSTLDDLRSEPDSDDSYKAKEQ